MPELLYKQILRIHPERYRAAHDLLVRHAASWVPAAVPASTPHFVFISDGTTTGNDAVVRMQMTCEQDYTQLKGLFGQGDPPGLPFTVHIDQNAGGAYHYSCQGTEIWTIPEDAPTLLVAEVVEVFEAYAKGWDCGQTNGEGLSRALAAVVRPTQVLGDIDGDVQAWWSRGNPPDYVNDNTAPDSDTRADACGTLFLFYLRSQLGYAWDRICANGAADLGATYTLLTGRTGAQGFQDFVTVLRRIDQGGQLQVPSSGNPFPIGAPAPPPSPPPQPPPPPVPAPDAEPAWWEQLEQLLGKDFAEWLEQLIGVKT